MAITPIALSDFTSPRVQDFQAVPTGPIASNAAAFQAIGISSITGTSDTDLDSYSTASPAASRSLAATSTGLRVIDPNSGDASDKFGNNNSYTINFAQPQNRFGFTNDDSGGSAGVGTFDFDVVLFSGGTQVDSTRLLAPVFGRNALYFNSTIAFDRVVISNRWGDGFVIDNLTTETPGPTVTTPTQTNITANSATLGGNVTADGGATITERGILLAKTSVNNNPQLNGNGVTKITATGTTGVFTVDATGLDFTTGYSYVAFATNSAGTTYTAVQSFNTLATTATLTTPTATNLTSTSARIAGSLPNTGGSPVTSFGYVYAKTTDDPTPQLGEVNVSQVVVIPNTFNVNASFNGSLLSGLEPATQYSLSTYAINSVGTSYSTTITFTTLAAAPSVTTPTSANVTSNSATLGGNVTADGGTAITERGILLAKTSTNNNPQLNGNGVTKITATGTTGVFTVDALGLDPETGYSYVAFATNAAGTTYTTVDAFTTAVVPPTIGGTVSNVTQTSAVFAGTISAGSSPATEFGYVFAKTTDDATPQIGEANVIKTLRLGGTVLGGSFGELRSGLLPDTQYTFAVYAIYPGGTLYGNYITFTTSADPTITSPTATNITANSATLGGNVTAAGSTAIIERGVLVSKTNVNNNPQLNGNGVTKLTATGTTGVFTVDALGLDFTTGYSYVAFATNSSGTTYTAVDTFTTLATLAALDLPNAFNVQATSAVVGGSLPNTGGSTVTEFGYLYAKTADDPTPQIGEANVTKVAAITFPININASFTRPLSGLEPATQYSLTTYAINSIGTSYSNTITFTTLAALPTVNAPTATNVGTTTAKLGGTVTVDGGATITERGIVYSITSLNSNPQLGGANVTQLTAPGTTGVFTIDVSALPTGTQISYAAYATNIVGTSYTTVGTFTTQPAIGQFAGITVQILNGQMIVTGTEQDDTIKVETDGSGGYIVTANQPINGLPSPQTFSGASSFVANTLGGSDDLWLAAPLILDSVTVDLGNGNDRLVLGADPNNAINNNVLDPQFGTLGYLTVNGPVNVIGGEGNDRVVERSTDVNGVKTINLGEGNNEYNVYWGFSNETIFSSGAGADNVYIGYLSSREASQFDTGAGNDLISYYASRFYKTAYLNSGAGADTVALDVNVYDDATTVDTGSEADFLLFSRSIAYKSVVLTTAGGADTVLLGKYISGLGSNGSPIYSNGGSNIDDLTLNTGVNVDTVQIAANVMRLFFANLGDAFDDAEVEFNLFTDGFLDGGGQDMRLRQRGNSNLRTRNTVSG